MLLWPPCTCRCGINCDLVLATLPMWSGVLWWKWKKLILRLLLKLLFPSSMNLNLGSNARTCSELVFFWCWWCCALLLKARTPRMAWPRVEGSWWDTLFHAFHQICQSQSGIVWRVICRLMAGQGDNVSGCWSFVKPSVLSLVAFVYELPWHWQRSNPRWGVRNKHFLAPKSARNVFFRRFCGPFLGSTLGAVFGTLKQTLIGTKDLRAQKWTPFLAPQKGASLVIP